MHEMSIAEGILDIALDTLRQHEAKVVHSVQLDLGLMSGVEPDALLFCWDAVTKNTPAEGSRIEINTIPIEGRCLDCDRHFHVADYKFICPYCDSHFVQTVGGRELQVTSMDID
ncbi:MULTISPECIES: hydrogenase maturation nickel metallochaperone HypA [Veillonella]|uniref:Hydrogenase maturation factor HypA n=1 Tax=Veillonella denticariosi JCM 15641 TaxID=1298594 RepID=A0A2S7Z9V9_9FIRM|nr:MULTISPECIES: hydrogenase maturation nickel metallochaperone HypA [Veillonella]ETS93927.1 hydrogenase nickel insertion protein HypA [Veillonella sp. AS16]PQL20076.1 hydrogenase maturation nickel metallochaperone HypA [Veillonella denticariosi JCM 15641]